MKKHDGSFAAGMEEKRLKENTLASGKNTPDTKRNYLDIKTVIVSCGTCMDQLLQYEFEKIFPGCRLLDIHEYLMEKGMTMDGAKGINYLYHDPCHTPMKTYAPIKVASSLMGQEVRLSDRCCGEAGTLAVSRPDISTQLRFRKQRKWR